MITATNNRELEIKIKNIIKFAAQHEEYSITRQEKILRQNFIKRWRYIWI
jgi:hypothetical protein